jgi:hypothetical protein
MDLRPYVEGLQGQLAVAAEAGGEDARALAERLIVALDASIRLTLLDVLTVAAEEITCDLAPGSVDVRLRGRDIEFVVTPPPVDPSLHDPSYGDDNSLSRAPVANEGLSVNAWLVRAAAAALEPIDADRRDSRRAPMGGQRYRGWVR